MLPLVQVEVSTLLEILEATSRGRLRQMCTGAFQPFLRFWRPQCIEPSPCSLTAYFQPFLRFWAVGFHDFPDPVVWALSTLLEILGMKNST